MMNAQDAENVDPMMMSKPIIRNPVNTGMNPIMNPPPGFRRILGEISNRSADLRINPAIRKPFQPLAAPKQQGFSIYVDPVCSSSSTSSSVLAVPSSTFQDEDKIIESEQQNASIPMDDSSQQDSSAMEEEEEEMEDSSSEDILETSAMILAREELTFCLDMDEYKSDIYKHLTSCQSKVVPKWNYMTKQPDITFSMRSILVDWLVEVGEEYKLHNETVYLAVNYIDRFLSFMSVQRAKLQLVGAACMFIASKYEEIYPPDVGEFVYITDDTYSKKQVLRMEHLVLKVLSFDLAVPTTYMFVTVFAKEAQTDERTTFLAMYLCELTLLDAKTYLMFPSNVIAAASLALARHTCGITAWPESVAQMSGVSIEDFKECLVQLHQTFTHAGELAQQSIREKYKTPKFMGVADIAPTPIC